jgi:hypothetical protein
MGLASEFKIPSELAAVGAKMTQLVMGLASEFKIPSELAVIGVKTTQLVVVLASELAAVSGDEQVSGLTHPVENMMMTMLHRHVDINGTTKIFQRELLR